MNTKPAVATARPFAWVIRDEDASRPFPVPRHPFTREYDREAAIGQIVSAIESLSRQAVPPTWDALADMTGLSTHTLRRMREKIAGRLAELGIEATALPALTSTRAHVSIAEIKQAAKDRREAEEREANRLMDRAADAVRRYLGCRTEEALEEATGAVLSCQKTRGTGPAVGGFRWRVSKVTGELEKAKAAALAGTVRHRGETKP